LYIYTYKASLSVVSIPNDFANTNVGCKTGNGAPQTGTVRLRTADVRRRRRQRWTRT